MVVDKQSARYNTPHRKLSLQSELDSLTFDDFRACYQIQCEKVCLRSMVKYIDNIKSQLVDCFNTESNKTNISAMLYLGGNGQQVLLRVPLRPNMILTN